MQHVTDYGLMEPIMNASLVIKKKKQLEDLIREIKEVVSLR